MPLFRLGNKLWGTGLCRWRSPAWPGRKWTCFLGVVAVLAVAGVWLANRTIDRDTGGLVYADASTIPHNKVGLLLGTSKTLGSGLPNQYFLNRIKAALELFHAGKIDFIVISGDNHKKGYNEPLDMKEALLALGIPENKIVLDYAGFRTYDSIVRLNKIFGQAQFTVISQEFHNRRAVYIARRLGLRAVGFNAVDVDRYHGFKTQTREKLARVKMFADLMVNKQPKFLGQPIEIR